MAPFQVQAQTTPPCQQIYYPLTNNLGTVNTLTNKLGEVVLSQHFLPFGESFEDPRPEVPLCGDSDPAAPADEPWPYGFTGQYHDQETGLVYFHARYYNPVIGHFMSPDSVIPNPSDTYSYDRYAYCRNNPVNLTDPTGHLFGIAALTVGKLVMMVLAAAVIGAVVANQSGGNVWQGALAGAITGFMTAVSAGTWSYFAATESVNVALHATSGGKWLISHVGSAIGSQILGDMIVSSLVTGAVLKISGAGVKPVKLGKQSEPYQEGDVGAMSPKEVQDQIDELMPLIDNKTATPEQIKLYGQLHDIQKAMAVKPMSGETPVLKGAYGPSPEGMVKAGRVKAENVRRWFAVTKEKGGLTYDVNASSASAPIVALKNHHMGWLADHTGASSSVSGVAGNYPSWSYMWFKGVCNQASSFGLQGTFQVTVTPLMLTSSWTAMLTTGAYGYYGIWGGLFWRAGEQYMYERSTT